MNHTGPIKVVHLTTTDMSLDWLLAPQLRAFIDAGFEVVGMSAPGPHVGSLEESGVRHVAIPSLSRSRSLLADVRVAVEIFRCLRDERPRILHTHNPKPGIIGRIVARFARVPVVVNTQHGLYAQPGDRRTKRWPVYAAERVAAWFSDAELVQNPEDVDVLVRRLRVPHSKVHLLGNGIDLARFDPAAVHPAARSRLRAEWAVGDDEVLCAVVGRLVWEKGLREVFDAARSLHRNGVRLRFVVIGPRDPAKADGIDDASMSDAEASGVIFTGERSDMPQCYAAADLFVLASHREGVPRAAMEAAAMGLPLVATDIRGCRQVVSPGVNGVLVPVRDTRTLETAIARLVAYPELRTAMSEAARPFAIAHFDQQRVIELTLDTYRGLLDRTRR